MMACDKRIWLSWIIALAAMAARADDAPAPPPVRLVGGDVYAAALPLAGALGARLEWRHAGRGVRLTAGDKWIEVTAGTPLARTSDGASLLPTCPILVLDALWLPAAPVLGRIGGDCRRDGAAVTFTLGAATVAATLPEEPALAGLDRLRDDLGDPRVDLADARWQNDLAGDLRLGLDLLNSVIGPLAPALDGVGKSRILMLAGHVPVVGSFVGLARDAAGALGETVDIAKEAAGWDDAQGAPLRRAFAAAAAIYAIPIDKPDPAALARARDAWQAAPAACDERLKVLARVKTKVMALDLALMLLNGKVKELNDANWAKYLPAPLSLQPVRDALAWVELHLDTARWRTRLYRGYFEQLVRDSGPVTDPR
jgi:hypothetical protein